MIRLSLEPTNQVVQVRGAEGRVWSGRIGEESVLAAGGGVECVAVICGMEVRNGRDQLAYEHAIKLLPWPQPASLRSVVREL